MAIPAMVSGDEVEAIRRARAALDIAVELGLEDVRAHALLTIGTSRFSRGEASWLPEIEESLAISERLNAAPEVIRAYKNLGDIYVRDGQLERGFDLQARGLHAALRFGDRFNVRWFRAERAIECYLTGRWDEAAGLADEFLGEIESGAPHYMESACRHARTLMRLARGDDPGALADAERLLAGDNTDPQVRQPALGAAARVFMELDRPELANVIRAATELRFYDGPGLPDVAVVTAEAVALEPSRVGGTRPWAEAARLVLGGDFMGAAEVYAAMGSLPDEADARLRAARSLVDAGSRAEADAQLQRALAFYRSVGATRYLRQGEALLAASA
jgi:tetratricopeptide (TPR) repeat protein